MRRELRAGKRAVVIPVRKPPALLVSTHQAQPFCRTRTRTRMEPLDANKT